MFKMKNFFLILTIFCLWACKSRTVEAENSGYQYNMKVLHYSTDPQISRLATDLPQNSRLSVNTTDGAAQTPVQPKKSDNEIPDTVINISQENSNPIKMNENPPKAEIKTLNSLDFYREVGKRVTQIVDVRTPDEYKLGHLYDAVNMDVNDPNFTSQIQVLDKNRPVAVYCRVGTRSMKAAQILSEQGFQIIFNLDGGIVQWIKDGQDIEK